MDEGLVDAGIAELMREVTRRTRGGVIAEEKGFLLIAGAHDAPYIVNTGMPTAAVPLAPEATVRRIVEFFHDRGRRAGFVTRAAEVDAGLAAALEGAGFARVIELTGMVCEQPPAPAGGGPAAQYRRIETARDVSDVGDVLADAFGPEEPFAGLIRSAFASPASVLEDRTAAVLVRLEDRPVSAAVSYALDGTGVLGFVGTRWGFNRLGLAELASRVAVIEAFTRGASVVVVQSSPMAVPVYRRIGFEPVNRYTVWAEPQ